MLLTIEHHSHHGLEVIVSELPEGKRFPGCFLQQAEGDADGVLWRETCRVDEPGGRKRERWNDCISFTFQSFTVSFDFLFYFLSELV